MKTIKRVYYLVFAEKASSYINGVDNLAFVYAWPALAARH